MARTKINGDQLGTTGGAWTTWTPTITSGTGSFTTVSATGKYNQIGKTVFFNCQITITTNGTAATDIRSTLPVVALSSATIGSIWGRETASNGNSLVGDYTGTNQFHILTYNNLYPGGNGLVLKVQGIYEAA